MGIMEKSRCRILGVLANRFRAVDLKRFREYPRGDVHVARRRGQISARRRCATKV